MAITLVSNVRWSDRYSLPVGLGLLDACDEQPYLEPGHPAA
ncbi:hypothetical protein [Micromonospora sp. NPDC007230]